MTLDQIIESCIEYNPIHLVHVYGDVKINCWKMCKLLQENGYTFL